MNKQIFRKKNLDRVASPEQLNNYIRVSNPAVWMVLAGIIILIVGILVWGIFGRLETKIEVAVLSESKGVNCYIQEADIAQVSAGMSVFLDDKTYKIIDIPDIPICVSEHMDAYLLKCGNLSVGDWVYEVPLAGEINEGIYQAVVLAENIAPITFILN